ncbi:response regulator [Flavobacterium sp. U410]|jgi:DNA-binding NarL/FixJ family response regulator
MIKLAIAEDNPFLLKAILDKLAFFEDLNIKIKVDNGKKLLEQLQKNSNVDLIIMDIEMPEMNGIEAVFQVKQKFPHIKIIMLTVFDNDENIFKSIKAGADGYLLKEINPPELYNAIKETLAGGAIMTPSIALKTLRMFRDPETYQNITNVEDIKLSQREIEVLEQLSKGLKYQVIAENLILSVGTIRKHIENIYAKLQVHNKLEAIQKAKNNKLI